jgi:hypothetical protein
MSSSISAFVILLGGESSLSPPPVPVDGCNVVISPRIVVVVLDGGDSGGGAPPLRQLDDNDKSHHLILVNAVVAALPSVPLPSADGPLEVVVVHSVVRCGKSPRALSTQGLYRFLRCNI